VRAGCERWARIERPDTGPAFFGECQSATVRDGGAAIEGFGIWFVASA